LKLQLLFWPESKAVMYANHYGLTAKPFSIVPNPHVLFLSKHHENALTYLEYGLTEKVGFILLTGEIGTGKTTLVRHMLLQMESRMDIAVIFNTNVSSEQLFGLILKEFGIDCGSSSKEAQLNHLYEFLIDRYASNRHVLLVIDEAQNLSADALEDIRMLSNLQTDDRLLLQIMLIGQPELKQRLKMPDLGQLAQRIAVNYHLTALDDAQTRRYIAFRIQAAGGAPDLFSAGAVKLIHDHSGGVPRTINLLCDAALVYGYAEDLAQIDETVVAKVLADGTCLSVNDAALADDLPTAPSNTTGPDDLRERLAVVEASLKDLKRRHDGLHQAVQQELIGKYQELLVAERKRYDQLLTRHNQLKRMLVARHNNGNGGLVSNGAEDKDQGATSAVRQGGGWREMMGRMFNWG
jgi:putative secretion ATPase (PEP-CTERM system associated)